MNIEDKLEKIINDIEKVNTRLETIQTDAVFYDVDDLARIMKIGKTKAYNLMNYKGFPVAEDRKKKSSRITSITKMGSYR